MPCVLIEHSHTTHKYWKDQNIPIRFSFQPHWRQPPLHVNDIATMTQPKCDERWGRFYHRRSSKGRIQMNLRSCTLSSTTPLPCSLPPWTSRHQLLSVIFFFTIKDIVIIGFFMSKIHHSPPFAHGGDCNEWLEVGSDEGIFVFLIFVSCVTMLN